MASGKEFLNFIMEQLSQSEDVTYRAMMSEYIIYYHGKIIGGIYDNRFLVKPTAVAHKIIPDAQMEIPYPGGKPMIMVPDIENQDLLIQLFNAMYDELA